MLIFVNAVFVTNLLLCNDLILRITIGLYIEQETLENDLFYSKEDYLLALNDK